MIRQGGDTVIDTQHYGRKIRQHRENRGWTIRYTAELCNMSDKGYELIELGDSDPKLSHVLMIAAIFDMDLGELNSCIPLLL